MKRGLLLEAVVVSACAHAPRPVVFAQLDRERVEPAVVAAKSGSPTLFGKAEALRAKAEQAFHAGDSATAELLAQHALATYHHAVATARLTAATIEQSKHATRLTKATEQLAADEASRVDVDREADRLDAEVAIRREALAPVVSGKTDPAREAARWTATRANLAVAEALCTGAQLLAPNAKGVADAQKILGEVAVKAKNDKNPAPIDSSTRARAFCLKALTNARSVTVAGGGPTGDALAKELTDAGFPASRDERGVVATLAMVPAKDAPFEGSKLTAPGKAHLETLAKIAKARPTWGIVVVVHAAPGKLDPARDAARAKLIQQELMAGGVDGGRIAVSTPGATLLAHDPKDPKSHPLNERIEIVFVGAP